VLAAGNVVNPAASHANLSMSALTVGFNGRSAYSTFNLYGGLPDGAFVADPTQAAETDRGSLYRSYDGKTFTRLLTTSGAKAFVIGSKFYNGYVLNPRNTWYRWLSGGDAFTTAAASRIVKVTMVPTVAVKAAGRGSVRTITGTATRPNGVAQLQRLVRGKFVPVVSTRIVRTGTWTGRYAFAKRALPRGTFRVITIADVWAGTGSKAFKI
jgi:hypothetical protein